MWFQGERAWSKETCAQIFSIACLTTITVLARGSTDIGRAFADPHALCGAQTMEPRDEDKFDFDPLDVTKIWPEHLFPLQPVGRMVLNKVRPAPAVVLVCHLLVLGAYFCACVTNGRKAVRPCTQNQEESRLVYDMAH